MIGSTLDKYEVLQKVGEGGMATVYRGRHTTLNREVAIKVLHPHLSSSSRNRKRFAREARAIEHLRHVNILEIFDYSGNEASDCYIITEYVEGETLSGVLRSRGRVPSEVAALIGVHLARALGYAHGQGILHRDLKPDNVMIRSDGTVKLMDFGIARFLDESQVTMTGALVGSPAFMSPEQARELPLDQRSDLFSLGTMLFYLVAGHLPFTGSNPSLILKNVIESNRPAVAELAPTMSARLADVIERLMAATPDDRHVDANAVAVELEAALAEADVDADDPAWGLQIFLRDPDAYEQRLEHHLRDVLLVHAKEHLERGDHLAALRLCNRLLSMDEDNPEVLELVQSLHGEPRRRQAVGILVLVLLAVVVAIGGGYTLWTGDEGAPRDAAATVVPAVAGPPAQRIEPAAQGSPAPPPAPVAPEPEAQDVAPPAPEAAAAPRERPPRTIRRPTPPPEPPPEEEEGGWIQIRSNDIPGKIYIDGRNVGSTRNASPIPVRPGTYEVIVRGLNTEEWSVRCEVGPGERCEEVATLQLKPATIEFPDSWAGGCVVSLDGSRVGTIAQLAGVLVVNRPEVAHVVEMNCGEAEPFTKRYAQVHNPTTFPPPQGG